MKALVESPWLGQPGSSWCLTVLFFLTTLKGISGIKAPSQRSTGALGCCARRGGQPGVASPWLGVPFEQPFGPGAVTCPSPSCVPRGTPVSVCVYFSLFLDAQRRLCQSKARCLPGVSPWEGRGGRICTASLRWPKHVRGGGEEMLKRRLERRA